MIETKDIILKNSFLLFLKKSYSSVSMDNIQTASALSRGAIYHHFKSKKQIFKEVADKYLLPYFSVFPDVALFQKLTLKETIRLNLNERKFFLEKLQSTMSCELTDFSFFKLAFQAAEYYDDFSEKAITLTLREKKGWEECISYAIQNGEIRSNLNPVFTAQLLLNFTRGLGISSAFHGQLSFDDIERAYFNFYEMIKND